MGYLSLLEDVEGVGGVVLAEEDFLGDELPLLELHEDLEQLLGEDLARVAEEAEHEVEVLLQLEPLEALDDVLVDLPVQRQDAGLLRAQHRRRSGLVPQQAQLAEGVSPLQLPHQPELELPSLDERLELRDLLRVQPQFRFDLLVRLQVDVQARLRDRLLVLLQLIVSFPIDMRV